MTRPTNPSGNVLGDDEVERLAAIARQRQIPLIVDNAYGLPFPGAIFTDARLAWDAGIIHSFSLSKLGLPGVRTGIVVAEPEIVRRIATMTAIVGLANTNMGQAIVRPLLESGELVRMSREVICPFYRASRSMRKPPCARRSARVFRMRFTAAKERSFCGYGFRSCPSHRASCTSGSRTRGAGGAGRVLLLRPR